MTEFLEFIKQEEKDLIEATSEKDWLENKIYFVDEIVSFVETWQKSKKEEKYFPYKVLNLLIFL